MSLDVNMPWLVTFINRECFILIAVFAHSSKKRVFISLNLSSIIQKSQIENLYYIHYLLDKNLIIYLKINNKEQTFAQPTSF